MIKIADNPQEVTFSADELIVTKTNLQGKITYANRTFMRVANFAESHLLGYDHNIIRHPEMPRGVFYGLWKTLKEKHEFFGFVKNLTSDGHYYWVFANITPDYVGKDVVGYYSVRRQAPKVAVETINQIYKEMLDREKTFSRQEAPQASWNWMLQAVYERTGKEYEELVLELYQSNIK